MADVREMTLIRIFIGESDRHGHRPLYEALVEVFRSAGISGATVLRGIAGYGARSVYHSDRLLELSHDLPVVVEAVDDAEKIRGLLPALEPLMRGGLITLQTVSAIRCIPAAG